MAEDKDREAEVQRRKARRSIGVYVAADHHTGMLDPADTLDPDKGQARRSHRRSTRAQTSRALQLSQVLRVHWPLLRQ